MIGGVVEFSWEQTYRVPSHAMVRDVGDEQVLLNLKNESYYGLDRVGAAFLRALDESPSLSKARDRLLEEFDVERAKLEADLERLVGELVEHGLLESDAG